MTCFIYQRMLSYVRSHIQYNVMCLCAFVRVCALALLGPFSWAQQCKKWVNSTVPSGESQAVTGLWGAERGRRSKGPCKNQRQHHMHITSVCAVYALHAAYVGGLSRELIRCVICMGWKWGISRNMWEIHLWHWISLSCCCTWRLVTCGLI